MLRLFYSFSSNSILKSEKDILKPVWKVFTYNNLAETLNGLLCALEKNPILHCNTRGKLNFHTDCIKKDIKKLFLN